MAEEFFPVNNCEQLDLFTPEERDLWRRENEKNSFLEQLRIAVDCDKKSTVCLTVQKNELKELALNFFSRKGFYCVQNDAIVLMDYSTNETVCTDNCGQDATTTMKQCVHFVLTFVQKEHVQQFAY